jgi:Holliday junction resolvase
MFTSSVPATAGAFFDRTREREQIHRAIDHLLSGAPRWLCVVGPRKVGKTSLLLEVSREAREGRGASRASPPHFVVADVLDTMPVSLEFFRDLALRVVEATLAIEAGVSLTSLARDPAGYRKALMGAKSFAKLAQAQQSFLLELPGLPADGLGFVRECLELPEQVAQATRGTLVVAIDEFQELAGMGAGKNGVDPLPLMRSVWQRHRRVAYIASGSARSLLVRLATSEHSPFFQHFTLLDVAPFTEEEAVKLLVGASAPEKPIHEPLARRIFQVLGGNPFYLQVLGEALTDHPAWGVDEDRALKESVQQVLFSKTGRLALYFANEYQRLVGRATTLAATLDCLAEGPRRLTDVARHLKTSSGAALGYLERLGDAVVRTEQGHALADSVFGLWLRWRRPGGTVLPMRLVGDEGERTTAEHLATLGFELIYQSRGSRGAFDLIAMRGSTQLAVQVKRKPLPLRFTKAEWHRMEADAQRYGWEWAIAAVGVDGAVALLNRTKARRGAALTLGAAATIENLLAWLDERSASGPKKTRRTARRAPARASLRGRP